VFHIELMGARVASTEDSAKFGTQSMFLFPSFGAHRISNLKENDRQAFLDYCIEAK
jgi:hypothetical protein